MTARYIAISRRPINLRAWPYQGDYCLESRQSEAGIMCLNGKSPTAVLAEVTTDRCEENTPAVMARMVGSNVGWRIAPYLSVPTYSSSIGRQLTSVGDNIWIIPGLYASHDDNRSMMRGGETQLIGARALAPSSPYVMPGTYCKWAQTDSQQINNFRTVMTGELRHSLLNHSLIGADLSPQESSADVFAAGPECDLSAPAILPQLFGVRASHVLGAFPHKQVSEFLSDLLIGAGVASMRGYVTHQHAITLIVGTSLTTRYQQVFQAMGYDVTAVVGDAAFQADIGSVAHAVTS